MNIDHILVKMPEHLKRAFHYMLFKGAGVHSSKELVKDLGHSEFQRDIVHGLRPFFNSNKEFGFKIKGKGAYDAINQENGTQTFIFP
jgi:hypothetical protein